VTSERRRAIYEIHGLTVESPLPLDAPEVDAAPDYVVELSDPHEAEGPPPGRLLGEFHLGEVSSWCAESTEDSQRWILRYRGVGDVELDRRAKRITVHPSSGTDPSLFGILIGGSVLARALSGAGELVLHASAVEIRGEAVAILGFPRAGKSTLAALMCGHGARLVSDDVLRVDVTSERPMCFYGGRVLRLRPEAAQAGCGVGGSMMVKTPDARVGIVPGGHIGRSPLPLAAMLVPSPSRTAPELAIERLAGREGLLEVLRYPRIFGWLEAEPIRSNFDRAAVLASAVSIYRATVPWGPPFPPRLSEQLLTGIGLGHLDSA
jgi:hypothetical protein